MKAPGRVVPAQIEKGLPGMGRGRVGQVVNAPFIEGTGLATSHGVTVKSLVGLGVPLTNTMVRARRLRREDHGGRVDMSWTCWPVAAARWMVWSVAKTGRASENVTSVILRGLGI